MASVAGLAALAHNAKPKQAASMKYTMTYTGEWKDGQFNGEGTYTLANGSTRYTGEWRDGEHNGHGTYTFADGRTYSGAWKDGEPAP